MKETPKPADDGLIDDKAEDSRMQAAKDVTPQSRSEAKLIQKHNSVFFMYNGHEWEAFEVLGLPKGCDIRAATSHYQNLIRTCDPSTFEFFELAFSAILKAKQK